MGLRQRYCHRNCAGRHSDAESYHNLLRQRQGRPDEPCPDHHLDQHGECFVNDHQRLTFRRLLQLGRQGHLQGCQQHAGTGIELFVQRPCCSKDGFISLLLPKLNIDRTIRELTFQ